MTAVSFSMSRGFEASGFKMNSVTVGTSAPGTGDFEFRFNVTDTNGKNLNDGDLYRVLKAFQEWVLINGGLVGGLQVTGITQQPSGPPN